MFRVAFLSGVIALCACSGPTPDTPPEAGNEPPAAARVVNVYSARHYISDQQLYDAFAATSGIEVRAREAGAAQLVETMRAEGEASPADVIIAADAGTLWRFKDQGLTQPLNVPALDEAIPDHLRDDDDHWVGLAKRYRVIAYDPERVDGDAIQSMEDLAEPRFEGEICIRPSSNVYNLSLIGEIIERKGAEAAEAWAAGLNRNLARDPQGGDIAQIEAVAAGACSIAIVNHYYWLRLATSDSEARQEVASKTRLAFPDAAGAGVHTNVTAAAIAAHAPHPEAARAFIAFLASPEGQALLVQETTEIPIHPQAERPAALDLLPDDIAESDLPLSVLGENQAAAQQIYDRTGWN